MANLLSPENIIPTLIYLLRSLRSHFVVISVRSKAYKFCIPWDWKIWIKNMSSKNAIPYPQSALISLQSMWIHNFQTVTTRNYLVGLYIICFFVPDIENKKQTILIIISDHHLKPDELNIVICRLRLLSVCKMHVITVWIIVFAITVFLIEKLSWLGWLDCWIRFVCEQSHCEQSQWKC